jgi:hypothetical protein
MSTRKLITIGRREKISFPELKLFNIVAKVDTGAYTAALHCKEIELEESTSGSVLQFKLLDETHPEYNKIVFSFTTFGKRKIKNSSGVFESRYTIKTPIKIGRKKIVATISLTDRGGMKYPVLIGRKLLNKRFLVDVSQTNMLEKREK